MRLKEAVMKVRQNTPEAEEGILAFIALYNMLGSEELYDGIASAMQDAGFDEAYEDIIYYKDDYDEIDDIIEESGE